MTRIPKPSNGLVAILNNTRDFDILQREGWYRVPVTSTPRRWPPRWLAFYQTKVFGLEALQSMLLENGRSARLATLLAALALLLTACGPTDKGTHWQTFETETGSLEVRYQDAFVFGSHTVLFYFHDGVRTRFLGQTRLHNDGANLSNHNLSVTALGDGRWRVTLSGQEQADEHWLIETEDGRARMEKLEQALPAGGS